MDFSSARIYKLNEFNYPKFREKILDLYLNAFTSGENSQFISSESAESTLDEILRNGFGNMAFIEEHLVGVLLAFPLGCDVEFPKEKCSDISIDTSIYIAELMVHSNFRGKGIASNLLETFFQEVEEKYTNAVIRVWDKNKSALKLYQKMGFVQVATISQTKLNTEQKPFEMQKLYMVKKLKNNK